MHGGFFIVVYLRIGIRVFASESDWATYSVVTARFLRSLLRALRTTLPMACTHKIGGGVAAA